MAKIQVCAVPRLKCDLIFGLPVLAVLGIINSLWASAFIIIAVHSFLKIIRWRRDYYLIGPIQNTYYLLCCFLTVMLYYGFKTRNKKFIYYWRLLKLIECGLVICGVLLFTPQFRYGWPRILIAIPVLCANWYVITAVQQGCRELDTGLEDVSISNFNRPILEKPPPYKVVENTEENVNV